MIVERLRRWARSHTRRRRYSPVGVTFHWAVAGLVLMQLVSGWRAGRTPVGADMLSAYERHAHIGLLIFVIMLLRMTWRALIPGPINDADKPGLQSAAGHAVHIAFYLCLMLLPLSGWAMVSATAPDMPLSVAGLLPWPHMPFDELPMPLRWRIETWGETAHLGVAVILAALIVLHVGGAALHELVHRDDVLMGMLPGAHLLRRALGAVLPHRSRPPEPRPASGAD